MNTKWNHLLPVHLKSCCWNKQTNKLHKVYMMASTWRQTTDGFQLQNTMLLLPYITARNLNCSYPLSTTLILCYVDVTDINSLYWFESSSMGCWSLHAGSCLRSHCKVRPVLGGWRWPGEDTAREANGSWAQCQAAAARGSKAAASVPTVSPFWAPLAPSATW